MSDPKEYYSCSCESSDFKYRKLKSGIHKLECMSCGKLIIAEPEMKYTSKYLHAVYSQGTIYDPKFDVTYSIGYLKKMLRRCISRSLALSKSMGKV